MPVTIVRTSNGKLDSKDKKKIEALETRLESGARKVVLYLHGGLVNEKDATDMALRLSGKDEGALHVSDEWEQVYVLWRTGVRETLEANWTDIFDNDRLYRALLKRLISFFSERVATQRENGRTAGSVKLLDDEITGRLDLRRGRPFQDLDIKADGAGRAGLISTTEIDLKRELGEALQKDGEMISVGSDIDAFIAEETNDANRSGYTGDAAAGKRTLNFLSKDVQSELQTIGKTGRARAFELGGALIEIVRRALNIAGRVIERFRSERAHGLHATIAEEVASEFYADRIGSAIWYMMVKDAADHFASDGLGSRLLDTFAKYQDLKLVIVGHSAGSIWATEMLSERAKVAALPKVDLVLLAPAVRVLKFAKMLDVAADTIDRVRIFAMKDDLERADILLGSKLAFLYPSSLLYLVSGAFEHNNNEKYADAPLLGMERFIGGERKWLTETDEVTALAKVRSFLDAGPNRLVLSVASGGPGLNSASKSHGGFDDDADTLASILTYLA